MTPSEQHARILNLANAGSLHFALAEYVRCGLQAIRHDEDIMALHARLYKDVFLSETGAEAREAAKVSAQKYQTAFEATGGFYSGINAATMALIAGEKPEVVKLKARRVLEVLPAHENLDAKTLYFVEATRAEAVLLLGDPVKAEALLQRAIRHDPLNYRSHATTLKQFRMILAAQAQDARWLKPLSPPNSVHYIGHIVGVGGVETSSLSSLSEEETDELKAALQDFVQARDIGFGYGSLAAGADILIAEVLLGESCELRVNLPVAPDLFAEHSVRPFGEIWEARFRQCLDKAKTVRVLSDGTDWPRSDIDDMAAILSMGQARRRAKSLSVDSLQLVVLDPLKTSSSTARQAHIWQQSGREQILLNPSGEALTLSFEDVPENGPALDEAVMLRSSDGSVKTFNNFMTATHAALRQQRRGDLSLKQCLIADVVGASHALGASEILSVIPNGSIGLFDTLADFIETYEPGRFETHLVGHSEKNGAIFTLRPIGGRSGDLRE